MSWKLFHLSEFYDGASEHDGAFVHDGAKEQFWQFILSALYTADWSYKENLYSWWYNRIIMFI